MPPGPVRKKETAGSSIRPSTPASSFSRGFPMPLGNKDLIAVAGLEQMGLFP